MRKEEEMIPYYEIVHVLDDATLINAESYQCRYEARPEMPLKAGFYVAIWREFVSLPAYNRDAEFLGPFDTHAEVATQVRRLIADNFAIAP
jgi:hypothetical protein